MRYLSFLKKYYEKFTDDQKYNIESYDDEIKYREFNNNYYFRYILNKIIMMILC